MGFSKQYLAPQKRFYSEVEHVSPLNMRAAWTHLFRPDAAHLGVRLGARMLEDVFVTEDGLVLKSGLLVSGCAPNLGFSTYDRSHFFQHWRIGLEQYLVSARGRSLKQLHLDKGKSYLLIHSPWFSYYFWITECLPRLMSVQAHHAELHLIYPEVWDEFPFVRESLSLFPKLRWEVVPNHYHLKVPHLIMPEVKPWTPMFIPEQTKQVRSLLLNLANSIPATAKKKVYISRKKAARKKFQDEVGAEAYFSEKGFESVYMEELSFKEQIALARDAEEMIAITGAGTINAMFMKPNSLLLDLTNTAYLKKKQYKFHYFKMCNILKINYAVLFCEAENDPSLAHYSMQNLILNTENFEHLYAQIQRP